MTVQNLIEEGWTTEELLEFESLKRLCHNDEAEALKVIEAIRNEGGF